MVIIKQITLIMVSHVHTLFEIQETRHTQIHNLMCLAVSLFALTYWETYFPQLSERQ